MVQTFEHKIEDSFVQAPHERSGFPVFLCRLESIESTRRRNMGAIIGWAIFGLIAGAIAKLLMPGKDPGGLFVTMLLGIAGALLGGFIGRAVWGSSGVTGWGLGSFALAIGGAVLLLFIYRLVVSRRSSSATTTTKPGGRDRWAA
jgi:uncharacterized membrane protein YeaQ/YmgE (transglycosylase-associated protein family)